MRDRPVEAWRRVPPALGAYVRRTYDERTPHAAVPPIEPDERGPWRWGNLYWADGFRSAYVMARRQRAGWRMEVWTRGRPRPCSTFGGVLPPK